MLIPKQIRGQMALVESAPFVMQDRIQKGCDCGCGWDGDPFLQLRAIPRGSGIGWTVMQMDPGAPPIIIYRSDRSQPLDPMSIDHRIISYLAEARRNYLDIEGTLRRADEHDEQLERDTRQQEAELTAELAKFVGRHLRKEGLA